jgi:hypothetical protein
MEQVIISLTKELLATHTSKKLSKAAVNAILFLYNEHKEELLQLLEDGFAEDFSDINFSAWFKFVVDIVIKIDDFRKLSGKEKKDVVIELCLVFVRKEVDTSDDVKELLVTLLEVTLPTVIDKVILVSKKLHTFGRTLRKKLCC